MNTINDCKIIELPKIHDPRGNLSFIEEENHVPFQIKRVYWIYDVPGGQVRGGHAFREQFEFIVAISGSLDVYVDDGKDNKLISLNRSYYGLYDQVLDIALESKPTPLPETVAAAVAPESGAVAGVAGTESVKH